MRRLQCNFGLGPGGYAAGELIWQKSTSGGWTLGEVADTSRGGAGAYTLQAVYSGSGAGNCNYNWNAGGIFVYNVYGGFASTYLLAGTVNSCDVRIDFKWAPPASNNIHQILTLSDGTSTIWIVTATRSGSDHTFTIQGLGGPGNVTSATVTGNTWYRLEIHAEVNNAGQGYAELKVYTIATNTVVVNVGTSIAIGTTSGTQLKVGRIGGVFQNGAQTLYYANLAINDGTTETGGSGVHNGPCGGGAAAALLPPTSDVTTGYNSTGASHYTEVDEANHPALNDADYISTVTGASTPTDRLGTANYAGANAPRSVLLIFRHGPNAGANDASHVAGFHDGTNAIERTVNGVGGFIYEAFIIDEKYGGGALDATYYNALDLQFRKTANVGGTNDQKVSLVAVEVEDTEGLALPTLPAKAKRHGHVY